MANDSTLRIARPDASVTDLVVGAVRQAISMGELAPGQRLTEREMIERTGVSRTSVREALRHLQAQGLVEPAPGGGLAVAVLDRTAIEHLYEVRGAIEPTAIRLFTLRATDEDIAELARLLLEEPRELPGDEPMLKALEADRMILRIVGNPVFTGVMEPLYARIQRLRVLSVSLPGRAEASRSEMEDIVAAVRDRDASRAEHASRRHVEAARESAVKALDQMNESQIGL
ncbi:GntR family transcriptional regulator [Rhodococcus koreensis]